MAFTVPDKGEGINDAQSILWQEHIRLLQEAILGEYGIISGFDVTATGGLNVTIVSGTVRSAGQAVDISGLNTTLTPDATNSRFVTVAVNLMTGPAINLVHHTPASPPLLVTLGPNNPVIAFIYLPAGATSISAANIIDARLFLSNSAKGGGTGCFHENGQLVSANYTITSGKNAMSAGPITIDTGITVTVPAGSVWTIV